MDIKLAEALSHTLLNTSQASKEYEDAAHTLHQCMSRGHLDQLKQLVDHGPVWDGDVISKSRRNELIELGLATRICVKGEQGFTAANYIGWDVLKVTKDH